MRTGVIAGVVFVVLLCAGGKPGQPKSSRVRSAVSEELLALYNAERVHDTEAAQPGVDREVFLMARANRRQRVSVLTKAGQLQSAEDHYAAGFVFFHAGDWVNAHETALAATVLGHPQGPWLAAASWDRLLQELGRPQRFGTSPQKGKDGVWTLEPVDDDVSDALRRQLGVPSLALSRQRAAKLNAP